MSDPGATPARRRGTLPLGGDGKTAWFLLPRHEPVVAESGAAERAGQDELRAEGL